MSGMGDDKSCTLMCFKGDSKFVLADRDHKRAYQLDKAGQEKARDFAGEKVKVTGRLVGKNDSRHLYRSCELIGRRSREMSNIYET